MLEATNYMMVHGGIDLRKPSLAVREVPTTNGVETGLEPSMLCLLRRSMAYFC